MDRKKNIAAECWYIGSAIGGGGCQYNGWYVSGFAIGAASVALNR
jgi:hypothetical protein